MGTNGRGVGRGSPLDALWLGARDLCAPERGLNDRAKIREAKNALVQFRREDGSYKARPTWQCLNTELRVLNSSRWMAHMAVR